MQDVQRALRGQVLLDLLDVCRLPVLVAHVVHFMEQILVLALTQAVQPWQDFMALYQ